MTSKLIDIRTDAAEPLTALSKLIESLEGQQELRDQFDNAHSRAVEAVRDLQRDLNVAAQKAELWENSDPRWMAEQLTEGLRGFADETIKEVAACIAQGRANDLWKVLP